VQFHALRLLWAIAAVFLGVYNVSQNINIPLIVQPQLFGLLGAISWSQVRWPICVAASGVDFQALQCLYYSYKRSPRVCAFMLAVYCAIGAGFEAGMVFVARVRGFIVHIRPPDE
jgi:hypothetical protein